MTVPLWVALLTAIAPAALLATTVWRGRGDWRLLFGPALMLGSVLPVYSYFFVDANLMSSRYVYFAAAGWAMVMADLTARALPSRGVIIGALGAALMLVLCRLQLNLRPWRTVGTMVTDIRSRIDAGEPANGVVPPGASGSAPT